MSLGRCLWVPLLVAAGCSFDAPGTTAIDAPLGPDAPVAVDAAPDSPDLLPDAPPDASSSCTAWCHSKTITIQNAVAGPHVRFIMLLKIVGDLQLLDAVRSDGGDIRFRDPGDHSLLPYERISYQAGTLLAWVQVPSLANGTTVTMEYGAATAPDQSTNAWTASWAGVYRLDEASGDGITDRAVIPHDGMLVRGMSNVTNPRVDGFIGKGLQFDGADEYVTVPQSAQLDATGSAGTIELWARPTGTVLGSYQTLLVTSNRFGGNRDGYELARQSMASGANLYFYPTAATNQGGEDNYGAIANPLPSDAWTHVAVTWSVQPRTVKFFINGVMKSATHDPNGDWDTAGTPGSWTWGNDLAMPSRHFVGTIDELRVSTIARSASWLGTEYSNQHDPVGFRVLGSEVVQP